MIRSGGAVIQQKICRKSANPVKESLSINLTVLNSMTKSRFQWQKRGKYECFIFEYP